MKSVPEMRRVVASRPTVRAITSAALWLVLAAVVLFPGVDLPLRRIWPLVLASAGCRTVRLIASPALERRVEGPTMAVDALLFTGLLDITGGPFNPFILMYGVLVWLAAAAVSRTWAAIVGVVALTGSAWLVADHLQNFGAEHHRLNDFPTHLFTLWMSGVVITDLVVHYVTLANRAIAERQRDADEARARAVRSEHLASLMTLAAGAAHELSTPLGTIAVAARELERASSRQGPASLVDDARLIRTEVDRCQFILSRLSGRAGSGIPDAPALLPPAALARRAAEGLPATQRQRLQIRVAEELLQPSAGAEAADAVSSLLKNAFDASHPDAPVVLRIEPRGPMLRIEVHDQGSGMSDEVMRRAGEPFFTTKDAGHGLGLGVFLARTFAERLGGTLWFERRGGTLAIMEIPRVTEEAVA